VKVVKVFPPFLRKRKKRKREEEDIEKRVGQTFTTFTSRG